MIWKSKKWRLSTYITLILVISIIGKTVGFRFYSFLEIAILTKNISRITYYFLTYHMIQEFISGKVHIKWEIILFYIKYHFLLINFEVLNRNKFIYDLQKLSVSSNINEVIRIILNILLRKDSTSTKSTKTHKKLTKNKKDIFKCA